jgi:hypothetical protein
MGDPGFEALLGHIQSTRGLDLTVDGSPVRAGPSSAPEHRRLEPPLGRARDCPIPRARERPAVTDSLFRHDLAENRRQVEPEVGRSERLDLEPGEPLLDGRSRREPVDVGDREDPSETPVVGRHEHERSGLSPSLSAALVKLSENRGVDERAGREFDGPERKVSPSPAPAATSP